MKRHFPYDYEETFKFLTVHDYVIRALAGAMVTDETQASRTQLFNMDDRMWAFSALRRHPAPMSMSASTFIPET